MGSRLVRTLNLLSEEALSSRYAAAVLVGRSVDSGPAPSLQHRQKRSLFHAGSCATGVLPSALIVIVQRAEFVGFVQSMDRQLIRN